MSIDPRYVAALDLQQYLVSKSAPSAGFPLAGGKVYFYRDAARTTPKTVYQISGDYPDYVFVPLSNPMTLSGVGTTADDDSNDVIPYYFPYLSQTDDTIDLYYIEVYDAAGKPAGTLQFTREAWPPNVSGGGTVPGELNNIPNFVPNGQFLIHNTINPYGNNQLSGGTTPIAPGGWYVVLPDSISSINRLQWHNFPVYTDDPFASPPYAVRFSCVTPSGADTIKNIRLRFDDVNKFASDTIPYVLAFWAQATTQINVTIYLYKYFGEGGSSFDPVAIETISIGPEAQWINIPIPFGNNDGFNFGTGQTYIAIDWGFPLTTTFDAQITDVVLSQTSAEIIDYPVQTNADTFSRTIFGWLENSVNDGSDLFLPVVKTLTGSQIDFSSIGTVEAPVAAVIDPNSTDPLPKGNQMPCDGASYSMTAFSALGIPYSRLGNYLLENSPVENIPMYGTGVDFATAYLYNNGPSTIFSVRLTINSAGAGLVAAADGNTGLDIGGIVIYGGSSTGSNSLGYSAVNNVANTVLAVNSSTSGSVSDGTSPFTTTVVNTATGLLADQNFAFTVLCTAASTLETGTTGLYFSFGNGTTTYRMWFNTGTETAPASGGATLIEVKLQPENSAQDVANIVREVINAYQISNINIPATTTAISLQSRYWTFSANPGDTRGFYVWYNVGGGGSDPALTGRAGIEVPLATDASVIEIGTATQLAINTVQYAVPDFRGMWLRGADFDGTWDKDVAQRWGVITALSGANYGTFEYSQIISHLHAQDNATYWYAGPGDGTQEISSGNYIAVNTTGSFTQDTGGTETRTVNTYVQWVIRY